MATSYGPPRHIFPGHSGGQLDDLVLRLAFKVGLGMMCPCHGPGNQSVYDTQPLEAATPVLIDGFSYIFYWYKVQIFDAI